MNKLVREISQRLSFRPPQQRSLEVLDRIISLLPNERTADLAEQLADIKVEFPHFGDFEREFPSFCFALATGVGKTRLMGGFVAFLAQALKVRNFLVLAPGLTIYDKLKTDFTPNTPKYVFQGIGYFATQPPIVVTGDDYQKRVMQMSSQTARAMTTPGIAQTTLPGVMEPVTINIFNISKLNKDVGDKKGQARIRKLSEYIGQSYFDYLAGLDDLVILMDESHRYRADAGVKALNDLRPLMGLELTATPQVETGKTSVRFKNVIYDYPLSEALHDGFVKEPAVATRENFDASVYKDDPEGLERLKLEDAVRVHEDVKLDLELYHRETGAKLVKPFILIIASDTTHAGEIQTLIKSDAFFSGRYADKVILVHSELKGVEKDDNIQKLVAVEDPKEPTEIVIHVNMLKEGWDVTNLYTIVPLRKADSKTLVEQSIGRGLRLPFGKRVNDPNRKSLDRLTIIAHDRFQEIVDYANKPDSVVKLITINLDSPDRPQKGQTIVNTPSTFMQTVFAVAATEKSASGDETTLAGVSTTLSAATLQLTTQVFATVQKVVSQPGVVPVVATLSTPAVKETIKQQVIKSYAGQLDLAQLEQVIATVVDALESKVIGIPRITVYPKNGQVTSGYHDFDLDLGSRTYLPIEEAIRIKGLSASQYDETLRVHDDGPEEAKAEFHIIRHLIDYQDINYDVDQALIGKLASQAVAHIRKALKGNERDTMSAVRAKERELAQLIHDEMEKHHWEETAGFDVTVSQGLHIPQETQLTRWVDEPIRDVRATLDTKSEIRRLVFTGFKKCMFEHQKFDSNPERIFALVLEQDGAVQKWVKPTAKDIHINLNGGEKHKPDFIVETKDRKYLVEVKRRDMLEDASVVEKAKASLTWCENATKHEQAHGGKPWSYVLIPDDKVSEASTMVGLAGKFGRGGK